MQKEKFKQIKNIKQYKIQPSDRFFFDTNIWMYLLNELGKREPKDYSLFLKSILMKNAKIIINEELISEVLNRFIKEDLKNNFPKMKLKEFRKTDNYRKCYQIISALFKQLIENNVVEIISIDITKEELLYFLEDNTKEKQKPILDYKDYIFDIFAQKNNLILVTNDGDFGAMQHAETILSANPKLINKKIYS